MEYSTLARIAFNTFSIPSMSVEPEQMFSTYCEEETDRRCNLTITDLRSHLNMEAIECLKWWIKEGLVDGVLASLQMDKDEDEDEDLQYKSLMDYPFFEEFSMIRDS